MNKDLILSIPDTRPYSDVPNKNELLRYANDILNNPSSAQGKLSHGQLLGEIVQMLQQKHTLSLSVAMAMSANPAQYRVIWQYLCTALSPQTENEVQWLAFPVVAVVGAQQNGYLNKEIPVDEIQQLLIEHNNWQEIKSVHWLDYLVGSHELSEITAEDWFDSKQSITSAQEFAQKFQFNPVSYNKGQQVEVLYALCFGNSKLKTIAEKNLDKASLPLMQVWQQKLAQQGLTIFANPMNANLPISSLQKGSAQAKRMALDIFTANAVRSIRLQFPRVGVVIAAEEGGSLLFIFHPVEQNSLPPLVFRHILTPDEEISLIVQDFLDLIIQCKIEHIHIVSEVISKDKIPTYNQAIEMLGGNPLFT